MKSAPRYYLIPVILAVLVFFPPTLLTPGASSGFDGTSGKIDYALAEYLKNCGGEFIQIELDIAGGLTAEELLREMESAGETLDQKRRYGLRRLRDVAASAQADALEYLQGLESEGLVRNIRSHWLTNTISLEVSAASIKSAIGHHDITRAFRSPEPIMIQPDDPVELYAKNTRTGGGVEANLKFIGADAAWGMGYTGEGRIVCISDLEGVDGGHPALYANWKGHDGDTSAAWYGSGDYPYVSGYHGTHMMGIMVGHDDATGDTIGVAPGAKWIGGTGKRVFEWAADPDGDPNTTDDMPDVINMCWSYYFYNCEDYFTDILDMIDALGIVSVFAAGNGGTAPMSVIWPGDRADDSLTDFAIGSVDHRSGYRWFSSSRGPSKCDSISIKPNLCAPGAYIWSAIPDSGYEIHGGTSMAAPHVAGAVAILRQVDPNATAREIKEALIAGATPYGDPCPNNDCGWGILNIPGSIRYLLRLRVIPETMVLEQNYPNPFNPNTTIYYAIPAPSQVTLDIYNILGQLVIRLVDEYLPAGYHQIRWNGKDSYGAGVSSGIYLYQVRASGYTQARKMVFLK